MTESLEEGATLTFTHTITPEDLASAVTLDPQDSFPRVYATARMIALMELAAARLMRPLLKEGEMSVGASVHVSHEAPTPPGVDVKTTARFVGKEGKLFLFEVEAEDPAGIIGRGTHQRGIISTERLLAGAARRTVHKEKQDG
jgi:fluoroacetyl-CoA thioesterase